MALLDEMAALDPPQRREAAKELRKVTETFAEVPDGRDAGHILRLLARMLDFGGRALTGTCPGAVSQS